MGDKEVKGNEPRTFRMAFSAKAGPRPCPVKGCSGRAATWTAMQVHFWHRNAQDTVVILDKGNLFHPRCLLCDMLVPWGSPNGMHQPAA